jgi:hypothetical protein
MPSQLLVTSPPRTDPQEMLGFLAGRASERKLRLFACACVRRAWRLLEDRRGRHAVEVAERYADGQATGEEMAAARAAVRTAAEDAWAAALDAEDARAVALFAAREAAWDTAWYAGWAAARGAAWAAAMVPARGAARAATWDAALVALLRDLFGNPFRPVSVDPAWLAWQGGTVARLAQAAYDERDLPSGRLDPARLAVLADALEEAGCSDPALLGHLRSGGEHARGCLAVDALLGKS